MKKLIFTVTVHPFTGKPKFLNKQAYTVTANNDLAARAKAESLFAAEFGTKEEKVTTEDIKFCEISYVGVIDA